MFNAISFYVDGTVLNSVTHNSPWTTSQDAQDACLAYVAELNAWWYAMWQEPYLLAEDMVVDEIHPGEVRCLCQPAYLDEPPMPSSGGYEIEIAVDWDEWIVILP